ncbi:hypothetical protein COCCADRAFT_85196 [Bipolaris zeicola 26-R-13]|uniref:Uncharacterized protein n=1 Tax=Cochliobolus carbonum (strain 26-R-13) TaxID=930089 RepID=W6YJ56_COCC2|nr:uncharacterized protein COCCADRAFT_85196 [Bipolaris zeicola 26-R-13]EUC37673.1 hypothetical protein COCCADRAFT_85196 [Bipolaris zeicola 26-R-13]
MTSPYPPTPQIYPQQPYQSNPYPSPDSQWQQHPQMNYAAQPIPTQNVQIPGGEAEKQDEPCCCARGGCFWTWFDCRMICVECCPSCCFVCW